jgi:two-component system, NtrC family, response regulator HydG
VRPGDLDLRDLLQTSPSGGSHRFAGRRALLIDAEALGHLRKRLIAAVGWAAARSLLLRFGFAHGWRSAEGLRGEVAWEAEDDGRRAGAVLQALQGLARVEPMVPEPEATASALWRDSWEAQQQLLHLGRAMEPACWTLAGFASGYLSFAAGREILCREETCAGMGHDACRMVGRPREEWERLAPGADPAADWGPGPLADGLAATRGEEGVRPSRSRARRSEAQPEAEVREGIATRSEPMRRALDLALRLTAVDTTVLVTGESGVGKEKVARLVHGGSPRAAGAFLAVNCAAIPESLVESELFGHARGAFTGAALDRAGLFEQASGGTLFLDEVGELPPSVQPRLLRVLEERQVRRVGEERARPVDVRLVAATHRDLEADVEAGRFRRDLFYRLKVVEIAIPPLRDRPEDVLPLARAALQAAARRVGRSIDGLTPRAADQLVRYAWPGNVRELLNVMERAAVLADGRRVDLQDLPEEVRAALPAPAPSSARSLERAERELVLAALRRNQGHRARTARELGIGEATLYRRLRAWRLSASM